MPFDILKKPHKTATKGHTGNAIPAQAGLHRDSTETAFILFCSHPGSQAPAQWEQVCRISKVPMLSPPPLFGNNWPSFPLQASSFQDPLRQEKLN